MTEKRVKRPDSCDLRLAVAWLEAYESARPGDGDEAAVAMGKVASWLAQTADDAEMHEMAAAIGVKVSVVRRVVGENLNEVREKINAN